MQGGASDAGANALLGAINDQDDSILDNLGGLLSGSGQSSMMNAGSSILGSLLGGGGVGSLISAVAGFSGLGKGPAKGLMGLLAPIIFGVIKRKLLGGGGLNVGSLMGMLNGQKENIAAAMPAGFNLDSGITENVSAATQHAAREGKSIFGKLIPLALIAGALWFAYNNFLKPGMNDAADATKEAVTANMDINAGEVTEQLTGVMGNVTNSLSGITDVASAEAALPALTDATTSLGGISAMVSKLPEAAQGPIMKIVSEGLPQIQGMLDKIGAIPGVGPIIKPIADGLLEKLALFN